ncbi:MAG TPA: PTS sugar transporter subunit IIA [Xanthobacteraceae bacterium]|jgi:PTS system nitrogen regulatory IIA component
MTDLIQPHCVMSTLRASDKPTLLRDLSERAARLSGLDGQSILRAIQLREALGSTGVGQGIALPHARVAGLEKFFGLFARLERPIVFEAIDDRPVDLAFLLLIPEGADDEGLAALACASRRLRDHDVTEGLRAAKTSTELYNLLTFARGTDPRHRS